MQVSGFSSAMPTALTVLHHSHQNFGTIDRAGGYNSACVQIYVQFCHCWSGQGSVDFEQQIRITAQVKALARVEAMPLNCLVLIFVQTPRYHAGEPTSPSLQ
jgi:hypothetical protein